ncbi:MAG: hypothetical protein ACHQF3_04630, partial [Alphaproteobacteria bacterium]
AIERLIKREIPRESLPNLPVAASTGEEAPSPRGRHRGPPRHPPRARSPKPAVPALALVASAEPAAEPTAPAAANATPAERPAHPSPVASPRPEQHRERDRGRGPHRRHEREEPDERVVGMGDHVPAFLMRNIRTGSR